MVMTWGVLFQAFPLIGEEEGICANRKKTLKFGRSFWAFFFRLLKQAQPRLLMVVGCMLCAHG
jgi:hypothetical protein